MSEPTTSNVEEVTREFTQAIADGQCPLIKNVYIDLDCLQNYEIGALLGMFTVEEEYAYFMNRLPVYEQGYAISANGYFPALGFTSEQIDAYIADPKNAAQLMSSPTHTLFHRLTMAGLSYVKGNALHADSEPIRVWFNSHKLLPTEIAQNRWLHWANDAFGAIDTVFMKKPYSELTGEFFAKMDVKCIYDLSTFVHHPGVKTFMFEEGTFLEHEIWALEQADPENVVPPPPDRTAFFRRTADAYSVFCQLYFVDRTFLKEDGHG